MSCGGGRQNNCCPPPCCPPPCCPPACCPPIIIKTKSQAQQGQCCVFQLPPVNIVCEIPPPPRKKDTKICCIPVICCEEDDQGNGNCPPPCPPPGCCMPMSFGCPPRRC